MHPELTDEHEALRAVVREFAAAEIAPHAERWDAEHTFPVDVVRGMGNWACSACRSPRSTAVAPT